MKQDVSKYTQEDKIIWKLLFEEQIQNLQNKACKAYLEAVEELSEVFCSKEIICFDKLSKKLKQKHGWSIVVVPGLIPVEEFFEMIQNKQFPSSTWLRTKKQMEYLEEPDMFHDIFGHIPLLMNKDYGDFIQKFGKIGYSHRKDLHLIKQLQTLYWFTIEFGLVKETAGFSIYGAGILSSKKETIHVFENTIYTQPLNVEKVIETPYDISDIQETYFEIDSFSQLYESLDYFI